MFLARIAFFRLHESPRYLVHAGRHQEALVSLQMISRFNGSDLRIAIEDVHDHPSTCAPSNETDDASKGDAEDGVQRSVPVVDYCATREVPSSVTESPPPAVDLDPGRVHDATLGGAIVRTHSSSPLLPAPADNPAVDHHGHAYPPDERRRSRPPRTRRRPRRASVVSEKHIGALPRWIRRPMIAWVDRVAMVLSPQWMRTMMLVSAAWCAIALGGSVFFFGLLLKSNGGRRAAYTMFNVFLPKLLETDGGQVTQQQQRQSKALQETLWDIVIYTIGGCPGAIVSVWCPWKRCRVLMYACVCSLARGWSRRGWAGGGRWRGARS